MSAMAAGGIEQNFQECARPWRVGNSGRQVAMAKLGINVAKVIGRGSDPAKGVLMMEKRPIKLDFEWHFNDPIT
jgi:hypothetical protein